jgi:hypothetical protein
MDEAVQVSPKAVTLADIEKLEGALFPYGEPVEIKHTFSPGVYVREAKFPAGMIAIGHEHKTEHVNMILKGSFSVLENGVVRQVVAPCTFVSGPGVRKVALFHEETLWANVHPNPTNETEQDKLENIFIVKSETWKRHQLSHEEMKNLTAPSLGLTN